MTVRAAGSTAAIYTARANLSPLLIEGWQSGGQLTTTTEVENYPGFAKGIMGPELMKDMRAQAERFGTEFLTGDVSGVNFKQRPFNITVDGEQTTKAKTVIIATGPFVIFSMNCGLASMNWSMSTRSPLSIAILSLWLPLSALWRG